MDRHIVALFRFKKNYLTKTIEILKKLVVETRKEEGWMLSAIPLLENRVVFIR